ncbi:hypothetical protein DSECCO2_459570 [anaerobic digester metagenome]
MNNRTKKWTVVAGCLVMCVILAVLISSKLQKQPIIDEQISSQGSEPSDVTVNTPETEEKEVMVTVPDIDEPEEKDNGSISSGTEQTIQNDIEKPEYTEEQLTDPTQKPDGEKVTESPKNEDHDKVEVPKEIPKEESKPKGGGLPGFENVPDAGENKVIEVDGDGDINKQVGIMD